MKQNTVRPTYLEIGNLKGICGSCIQHVVSAQIRTPWVPGGAPRRLLYRFKCRGCRYGVWAIFCTISP